MSEISGHFLESLDVPAAAVTHDHTVALSNARLLTLLSKFNHDVVGLGIGAAMSCGCGGRCDCQCGLVRLVDVAHITRCEP